MVSLAIFGTFLGNLALLSFRILFVRKQLNNQLEAVQMQANTSFNVKSSDTSLTVSANTFEKYIVSKY